MNIEQIREKLEVAQKAIDNFGHLPYPVRASLLMAMGNKKSSSIKDGHLIRINIALSCAKKTLPIWEKAVPSSSFLTTLELAEKRIIDSSLHAELEKIKNKMITQVENVLYSDEKNHPSAYAGFSCVSAISTVLYDDHFDLSAKSELDIEPDEYDSGFHSSLATSGGAVWQDDIVLNNEARREFWGWYLDIAIPNTIYSVTGLNV